MDNPLEIPAEIAHLIEKREQEDRRKADGPAATEGDQPAGESAPAPSLPFPDRRRGDRRS